MNRQLLEQPFNQEQIKQRQGSFGNTLDYVEAHVVIQRLNDSFDGNWSFEIVKYEINAEADEVIVLAKLTAENVVKEQFGSSKITRNRNNGELVSLADDLKAAASDAIKKASTLMGVALHLYGTQKAPSEPRQAIPIRHQGHTAHGEQIPANDNTRLTNKQLNYIVNLGSEIGLDSKALDQESLNQFAVKFAYLTKKDASAFIDSLKRKAA
jgi:hypothetical protein